MAAAVIPPPEIHGNTTAAFSSPPPATSMSTVTPAGPAAATNFSAATSRNPPTKKRGRRQATKIYTSRNSISEKVDELVGAILGNVRTFAGDDCENSPRGEQIYDLAIKKIHDCKMISSSDTDTRIGHDKLISPFTLMENLNANMAILEKEPYQSKFHSHFKAQVILLGGGIITPKHATQTTRIKKYLMISSTPCFLHDFF